MLARIFIDLGPAPAPAARDQPAGREVSPAGCTVAVAMLALGMVPLSFSASTADAKQRLKGAFGSDAAVELLACPTTKSVLRCEQSVLGGQARRCLTSSETGARYPAAGAYYDLLPSASTTIGLDGLAAELREVSPSPPAAEPRRHPRRATLRRRHPSSRALTPAVTLR